VLRGVEKAFRGDLEMNNKKEVGEDSLKIRNRKGGWRGGDGAFSQYSDPAPSPRQVTEGGRTPEVWAGKERGGLASLD